MMGDFVQIGDIVSKSYGNYQVPKYANCDIHGEGVEFTPQGKCEICEIEKRRKIELNISMKRLEERKIECGIKPRFLDATFDSYNIITDNQQDIVNKLKSYDLSTNIVFIGRTGNGKSHLACSMIHEFLQKGVSCFYGKFYELMKMSIENKPKFQKAINSRFLVIDEYGRSDTDNKSNLLFEIVDYRYECLMPTMLLSNLSSAKIKENMSDAALSRLKESCLSLLSDWDDYRLKDEKIRLVK